jgi:hypothetical protein
MITQSQRLLEGAIDLHCHGYPEVSFDCKMSVEDIETANLAAQAKMQGFVLKSHMWPTVGRAYQLNSQIEGVKIWPSITLNQVVGGFSPWCVESALKQGAKMIWLPTWSSKNDLQREGASQILLKYLPTLQKFDVARGLTVFDDAGQIKPSVKEVLALAKDYDAAVSTGHLSPEEVLAIARQAKGMGLKKLIFCHPDSKSVGADMEHIKKMSGMDFFIEFAYLGLLPGFKRITAQEISQRIKEVGAEHSILTTDAFFDWTPPPPEMLRMFIGDLLEQGISKDEIEIMVKNNPSQLLGL